MDGWTEGFSRADVDGWCGGVGGRSGDLSGVSDEKILGEWSVASERLGDVYT